MEYSYVIRYTAVLEVSSPEGSCAAGVDGHDNNVGRIDWSLRIDQRVSRRSKNVCSAARQGEREKTARHGNNDEPMPAPDAKVCARVPRRGAIFPNWNKLGHQRRIGIAVQRLSAYAG
jgi:hypothetical protein